MDTGAAFEVMQHLSPNHKSMMNTLQSRHAQMPVIMVEEDMVLQANLLYLIPLAPSCTCRPGGFMKAHELESSGFGGMPRSAIATGVMDAILPAYELPLRLVAHLRDEPYDDQDPDLPVTPHSALTNDDVFVEILQLLCQLGGIDFLDHIIHDISARVQAQRQADAAHRLLATLLSSAASVLCRHVDAGAGATSTGATGPTRSGSARDQCPEDIKRVTAVMHACCELGVGFRSMTLAPNPRRSHTSRRFRWIS